MRLRDTRFTGEVESHHATLGMFNSRMYALY